MSDKRPRKKNDVEFELPALLQKAQEAAIQKMKPAPHERDDKELPHLVDFLTPFAMPDPKHKGEGEPKTIIREALLLITFDRREGCYKVSLSDKQTAVGGSCIVQGLSTALADLEKKLGDGTFPWSAREK
jgi:hypothetical protein